METWKLYRGSLEDQEFPCITAFFDESGHSASTRVVAMGGAIAGPKQWGEARRKWKATLDKFGVGIFHMTDFESRQGEFSRWDESRKRSFLSDLIGSFEEVVFLIGAAAVVQDFNRLPHNGGQRFHDPWYFAISPALRRPYLRISFSHRKRMEWRRKTRTSGRASSRSTVNLRGAPRFSRSRRKGPETEVSNAVVEQSAGGVRNLVYTSNSRTSLPMNCGNTLRMLCSAEGDRRGGL